MITYRSIRFLQIMLICCKVNAMKRRGDFDIVFDHREIVGKPVKATKARNFCNTTSKIVVIYMYFSGTV